MDSFEGMPITTPEDGDAAKADIGKEVGDIERVKRVLGRIGADMNRVRIVPGWFQDTFPSVSASRSPCSTSTRIGMSR